VTNLQAEVISCGSVVIDLSDHFMTFVQLEVANVKCKSKAKTSKNFCHENVNKFKQNLQSQTWTNVLACNDVNESYYLFWDTFKLFINMNFSEKLTNFNKNLHKLNELMTNGQQTSRNNIIRIHKLAVQTPTTENVNNFKSCIIKY
jgi:hypothetical protein